MKPEFEQEETEGMEIYFFIPLFPLLSPVKNFFVP